MKASRYVPTHEGSTITVALRTSDELVVVPPAGMETSDPNVKAALDARADVKREKRAAKPRATANQNQSEGQS